MWFAFSSLAGLLYTAEGLLQRHFLRQQKDAWAFSFYYSLVGTAVSLPFMLADPKLPSAPLPWAMTIVVGLLIVGNNLLLFKAANHIEASLSGTLLKLKFVWLYALSVLLLGTAFTAPKLLGVVLTIAAGLILMRRFRKPESSYGITLVLLATVFNALAIIASKYLLDYFNAPSLTFFATFLPALILNFLLMPRATQRIHAMFKVDWKVVFGICAVGALANLALNVALSLHEPTAVLVVSEVFLVMVLAGEHLFLKEKDHAWTKLASIILAVLGAIFIQL